MTPGQFGEWALVILATAFGILVVAGFAIMTIDLWRL